MFRDNRATNGSGLRLGGLCVLFVLCAVSLWAHARQRADTVPLDVDDIGGVVTNSRGPEAGVWVIAETSALPTGFRRIVVTDDQGRFLVPDLPKATYSVWVRGYGLIDSPRVQAMPGQSLNLAAVPAPNEKAAAEYYPASYWFSLFRPPDPSEFPGTGPNGNGLAEAMVTQDHFLGLLTTNGCVTCHQMGSKATRELSQGIGPFPSTMAAWDHRVQVGQTGGFMSSQAGQFGRRRLLEALAQWTERIASGALPPVPPRPEGVERNIVITQWDWGKAHEYLHDVISSDERDPTVNANGPIYGSIEASGDALLVLDPVRHSVSYLPLPVLETSPPPQDAPAAPLPSPVWGKERVWRTRTSPHSFTMDARARVWVTSIVRPRAAQPEWCKADSSHPSVKKFPLSAGGRQLAVYDPASKNFVAIDVCFQTHHASIAKDHTVWFNSGQAPGWFNSKIWDETGDYKKAQGWTPFILDTNGNGKQDTYTEPDAPRDPAKDMRIVGGGYEASPSPTDRSIWFSVAGTPGVLIRLDPGSNPPDTSLAEAYEVPSGGHTIRGGPEIDSKGVAWLGIGSGHMASFDRRKCKVLNGPNATGRHCPEGWTFYREPGPSFQGTDNGTDAHYVSWVDRFGTSGLGNDVPITLGSNSDSLIAMLPGGKFVTMRVPYPLGFYSKNVDGRIDDRRTGWKGRGLWTEYAERPVWHIEGGRGQTSKVVKFQVRPNPLAK